MESADRLDDVSSIQAVPDLPSGGGRRWGCLVWALVLVLLILVAFYGGLGWYVFKVLPARIADEERLQKGFSAAVAEIEGDHRRLLGCLREAGVQSKSSGTWRREALRRVLRHQVFQGLSVKYLGAASIAHGDDVSNRLRGSAEHEREVRVVQQAKKAALWDLRGATGPGSPTWEAKMNALVERLEKLDEEKDAVAASTRRAEIEAQARILLLRRALEDNAAALRHRLDEPARLRAERDRWMIWPLRPE